MKCGLLGRKLSHSYSPQIHSFLGNYSYVLFEKEPEALAEFLRNGDYTGLNVTIPYKKDVIPYLDEISAAAEKIGAVNTIVRRADGTLFGHNTDYFGFQSMVTCSGLDLRGKKVLALGSGGASNTAVQVLSELGAQVIVVSRNGKDNYENISCHADAAAIVNTTPVGMYPENGVSAVDLNLFPNLEGVLDLIYNPARTQLLLDAEKRGIYGQNGLWMLVAQAKEAAEYFTDSSISDSVISAIHKTLSCKMQNIILVGMPGSGKTTIGHLLAQKTGRTFADADELIVSLAGKSIPEIFAEDGEKVFRSWETKALEQLGKQSALIISTGGGCVTQQRNYPLLHQNGIIFWVMRDLDHLAMDGRPLSQPENMRKMYDQRKPLYNAFSDFIVSNDCDPEETVSSILALLEE